MFNLICTHILIFFSHATCATVHIRILEFYCICNFFYVYINPYINVYENFQLKKVLSTFCRF